MRTLFGLALAGALALGTASDAKAQLAISVGNPYGIGGYGTGLRAGYGGYGGYSAYSVAPLTTVYSSGYSGIEGASACRLWATASRRSTGARLRPRATPYYGGYHNVYRGGGLFRPFRRWSARALAELTTDGRRPGTAPAVGRFSFEGARGVAGGLQSPEGKEQRKTKMKRNCRERRFLLLFIFIFIFLFL